jgi:capsular polysaccharide biosynthesis protein
MVEESILLKDIIEALKKRWKIVVLIVLVITIITTFVSFFLVKPKYEASTKVFVGKESSNETKDYTSNDVQMYQQLLKTYTDVILTKDFVENAIEGESITSSKEEILSNLNITPKTNTQILEIKYLSYDKEEAKLVVEEVANEFIIVSTKLISNANVQIIEKATLPENPVSPNKMRNISIATALGIIIGMGVAIILEFMDTTFSCKEDIEKEIGLPILGVIPKFDIIQEERGSCLN